MSRKTTQKTLISSSSFRSRSDDSYYYYYWSLLYSADSLRSHVILHEWIAFYSAFIEYPPKWCTYSAGMAGATRNCCHLGAFCVHHKTMHHVMQSHIRKVYACLAVTCHLRFWQNDRGLLRATAVTRGWNGYRNKSQHRKLTLEKKILPPLQQGFKPATFRSQVRRSNHWAIPAPHYRPVLLHPAAESLHVYGNGAGL